MGMQQHMPEWNWFIEQVKPFDTFLEVGSGDGSSLLEITKHTTGLVYSIDSAKIDLIYPNIILHTGDSKSEEAISFAKEHSPFDVIFIDADHGYEGVKADWNNYKQYGKIISFHDICGVEPGVRQLWEEIYYSYQYSCRTICESNMGIGIVCIK